MGRVGDFIDVHITRAQKIVALVLGLLTLVGALIGAYVSVALVDLALDPVDASRYGQLIHNGSVLPWSPRRVWWATAGWLKPPAP